ncbi:ABC transporter ATP-binding protein [Nocardioides jishulii]|uniref:ABC transporter ATP-binding protein n=1 Tax=Nocardioides jishulii TaxID=2575440 RepID=A0A4V5TK75_9ACTN|nr:ABC transporter ATP-binding protein [Nocardioides jishulii]QCX27656.1 ABC transporter ATP-binding protein [Nocardioides jishulii]TKI62463.1 ABC transporter ATP-binding protein [Nocardioides jishulii]
MLTVDRLSVAHGPVQALHEVSLTAERGRITTVLGANGAGKTTLLRTISGLHRAVSGSVRLGDQSLSRVPAEAMAAHGLAHVPEGRGVVTELTVEENLRLGALARGRVRPGDLDLAYDLFAPLADRRGQAAGSLSGGERQMLVIGRALMARPAVLLLDEPSLGLAPRVVAQIFALLKRLVTDEGLTVLLVEQNARSALAVAHRGVVLHLGRVVADRDASELAADDALRHAYLGF